MKAIITYLGADGAELASVTMEGLRKCPVVTNALEFMVAREHELATPPEGWSGAFKVFFTEED